MKVTDIQIDRFGVWQNLKLPLGGGNVQVFYGPNEAGKTTLMRFLRGVLYGFDSSIIEPAIGRTRDANWSGALGVTHLGNPCEIRRVSTRGSRGTVRVAGMDRQDPADVLLSEILAKTDETVFQYVLSVGLPEIQELATLHADEVARHIYGTTLGPTGQRLLEVTGRYEKEQSRLLDETTQSGEFIDWYETSLDIGEELDSLKLVREEHAELCRERSKIEDEIDELKQQRADLEHQLRGHSFLERVWSPWNELREYEEELASIPAVPAFPDKGIARLDAIETELDSLTARHRSLVAAAEQLSQRAEAIAVPNHVAEHASTMQSLIDERPWLEETLASRESAEERAAEMEHDLNEKLGELGPEWSTERLQSIDSSPAAQFGLMQSATGYRGILARRSRLKKKLKRLSQSTHQKNDELTQKLKELGAESTEQALAAARKELSKLENFGSLTLQAEHLQLRSTSFTEQIEQLDSRHVVPNWFPLFLGILGLAGGAIAILGLRYSFTTNAIAGASFALLGLTGLGIVWGFRKQFGFDDGAAATKLREEAAANEESLVALRSQIAQLKPAGSNGASLNHSELIRGAVQKIANLERLAALESRLHGQRRILSELRLRFRNVQRDLDTGRQNWCDSLKRLGLEESVHINSVFELWQKVLEADAIRRDLGTARVEAQKFENDKQAFRGRVESLGRRMDQHEADYGNPLGLLDSWSETLRNMGTQREEYGQLRAEEAKRRHEAAELEPRMHELRTERSALFVQGGAANRDEFERRSAWFAQRKDIEELISISREELNDASRTEPDLALVEEDLVAYDADQNAERIRTIREELEELEQSMHGAFERVGRLKQSIEGLEDDSRPSQLRFEKARVDAQTELAAQEWFAVQIAGQALETARLNYERNCQPAVLASASRYLERLTRGRYKNIWCPIDRRDLRVDDDHGRSFRVDELSGGTREQLFLAVRLSLVREMTRQGIELPMFLDDILVNFDQNRTEAAVETLLEFAAEGQQILFFTCHLHLAHLFESRGIEPTWLPGHNPPMEERRAG